MTRFTQKVDLKRSPTWVAVVLDVAVEALLVAVELERNQPFVLQSLPGDDVDGRLALPGTVAVGVVPLLWCWEKRDKRVRRVWEAGYWLTRCSHTEQTPIQWPSSLRASLQGPAWPLSPGWGTFIAPMDKVHLLILMSGFCLEIPGFSTKFGPNWANHNQTSYRLVKLHLLCFSSSSHWGHIS